MRWLAAAILALVATQGALARDVTPAERRELPYDSRLPACANPLVLGVISNNFRARESRFWSSSLSIVSFEGIADAGWRSWGLDTIPRRFCTGVVLTSDGVKRKLDYAIREDLGIIGMGWDAEWCVAGLDRNYANGLECRAAQP